MIRVSDLSVVPDLGRHAHRQGNKGGVLGGHRRIEHDLAVFRLDRPVAEIRLLQRRPDILLGAGR